MGTSIGRAKNFFFGQTFPNIGINITLKVVSLKCAKIIQFLIFKNDPGLISQVGLGTQDPES